MGNPENEEIYAWKPEEQVSYLRTKKGISFELVTEEDARRFLEERTYFFKLKAFAKNFDKYETDIACKGAYLNLDFGHLVELSRLDEKTRSLFLKLTLDIEHYVRVEINSAAMRAGIDPRSITTTFLKACSEEVVRAQVASSPDNYLLCLDNARSLFETPCICPEEAVALANEVIAALEPLTGRRDPSHVERDFYSMKTSPFSYGLPKKYSYPSVPYWVCMETSSFGTLLKLYSHCLSKEGAIDDEPGRKTYKQVKPLLRRVKDARNASAHGDCLLNTLSAHSRHARLPPAKNMLVDSYGFDKSAIENVQSVRVAMDLVAVLICYDRIVPQGSTRNEAARLLGEMSSRYSERISWFAKTLCVHEFLRFASAITAFFSNVLKDAPSQE